MPTFMYERENMKQIKTWSELYGKPISDEEFKEICRNLDAFFSTLKEWDDKERMAKDGQKECISHQRPL